MIPIDDIEIDFTKKLKVVSFKNLTRWVNFLKNTKLLLIDQF